MALARAEEPRLRGFFLDEFTAREPGAARTYSPNRSLMRCRTELFVTRGAEIEGFAPAAWFSEERLGRGRPCRARPSLAIRLRRNPDALSGFGAGWRVNSRNHGDIRSGGSDRAPGGDFDLPTPGQGRARSAGQDRESSCGARADRVFCCGGFARSWRSPSQRRRGSTESSSLSPPIWWPRSARSMSRGPTGHWNCSRPKG